MKVKNIAFSGFAAMILAGVCGVADAASVNLASKSYVDTQLEGKADLIDLETLETTVGQKATQESLEIVATQVNANTIDIAALKAAGYVSDADLTELQKTLQQQKKEALCIHFLSNQQFSAYLQTVICFRKQKERHKPHKQKANLS